MLMDLRERKECMEGVKGIKGMLDTMQLEFQKIKIIIIIYSHIIFTDINTVSLFF